MWSSPARSKVAAASGLKKSRMGTRLAKVVQEKKNDSFCGEGEGGGGGVQNKDFLIW